MKIHEYQGKAIFAEFGVPVPKGYVAFTVDEAVEAAKKLGGKVVVKAQIHAGGRGKGGGVKMADGPDEAREAAEAILGMQLVTHQTGPEGKKVERLLVEAASDIDRELYAGIVLDRAKGRYVMMVSTEGGMEIEKVAAETPEKIVKEWIMPGRELQPFQLRRLAYALELQGDQVKKGMKTLQALWRAFAAKDCSLMEVNPLVVTSDGEVIALDAKLNFDDNALYRQKELDDLRDLSEENPHEVEASKFNLNYIKLDGSVGCMVNGAGLAMGTMDIIKLHGGDPANFLDVGGVANAETVANGFRIILDDPHVKTVLINIFGGIVRCDRIAEGIIAAMGQVQVNVPVVVRMEGTNAELGRKMLAESNLEFIVATTLEDAAQKAVAA
ncbi:MAG: ADP-forming succinate--CoA ligase subunit beta, partial [Candidatus Marinimicrobia bacterium]|nr:ADP-forming succinate--CoA ligase subunit beta [Candidatus Neomarinimicrobiota bacterium]